VNFKAVQINSS